MARLGDICKVVSGTTPKSSISEYWDGDVDWITPAELNDDSYIIHESVRKITEKAIKETSLKPFPAGTVILSSRAPIGKVAIAGKEMYCNQGFKNLICSDAVNNKYLYWFLKCNTEYLNSLGRGATFKEISKSIVEKIEIPLPDIKTQEYIASVFEAISSLIAKRREQLRKLDQLVKSQFIEMFGDPIFNPKHYQEIELRDLGNLARGVSKSRPRNKPELLGGPYPLVQTGEVSAAELYINSYTSTYSEEGLAQSKMWPKGTLCITIAANIAQTGILTFDACFPDSVVGFIPGDKVNQIYVHFWFSFFQKILEEQAPQVAQKNINLKILGDLKVMVPPVALQQQFTEFVQQADKSKFAIQQSLEQLETLKKSLMQEYFG